MAVRGFTETWLKNLKAGPTRRDFTEHGGFMVRLWPSGVKSFVYRYHRAGKQRILTLGTYPEMSLARAHREHALARELYRTGGDPIEEQDRTKRAAEAQERRRLDARAITVRTVIAEWAWHWARRERKRPLDAVRLLRTHLEKPLAEKAAAEITKRDLVLIIDRVVARGALVMANRLRDLIAQVFAYAAKRDLIPSSPAAGLLEKPGGDESSRDRWLNVDELRAAWSGLEAADTAMSEQVRLGLKLILVTAQRPGEIANARFDQFNVDAMTWSIPAEISKNGREHVVPLSDLASELVEQLRALAVDRPHLLPSQMSKRRRDEPISVRALSRALRNNITQGKRPTLFGLEPFTPHDLRRTAATHMTMLGTARLHVSKVLNHSDNETTAIYDRHAYLDEKRQALVVWADELRAIASGKARKVMPIKSR